MKLSTKGRYGLMAMYRLMENYGKEPISITDIAKKEHLSKSYLEQLFIGLRKANLIESTRGSSGGYNLTKHPKDINMLQIINALEGSMELTCCKKNKNCPKKLDCPTKNILEKVQNIFENVLSSMSLADMK